MKAPQIIVICIFAAGATIHLVKHGEKKEGITSIYHFGWHLFAASITVALLWWGGFWD